MSPHKWKSTCVVLPARCPDFSSGKVVQIPMRQIAVSLNSTGAKSLGSVFKFGLYHILAQ